MILSNVYRLPLPVKAVPGTRIRCARGQEECFDFRTLVVSSTAFWSRGASTRRTSNVIRAVRRYMDAADQAEGEEPDPTNHQAARRWVESALNAANSPLILLEAS